MFGIVWSLQYIAITDINLCLLIALIIGITCCHIAANTFNDYFDWISGADKANTDFIMSISGGSRAMEFGIISEQKLFIVALFNLLIAAICALYISMIKGPVIIVLSSIGAFAIYFYTAPPIRLAAKYGLGEVFIFLCFGPIFTTGVIYVLTSNINWESFFVGVPIGLLITSILLINEYPDLKADINAKKTNLAVVLGSRLLPFAVVLLILSSYLVTITGIFLQLFPKSFLLSMLTLPFAMHVIINIINIKQSRSYIQKACLNNIKLYAFFGLTFIVAGIMVISL